MSAHRIAQSNFEFWDGEPPSLAVGQIEVMTRAGTYGISELKLGRWGQTFRARLTSDWKDYPTALSVIPVYQRLIGAGPQVLTYNGIDFVRTFKTGYTVQAVTLVDCRCHVFLVGPGYAFRGGARLVTDWTMTPLDWSGPKGKAAKRPV
jgi:hypothetical protein